MARKKSERNPPHQVVLPFSPVLVQWTDAHDPGEGNGWTHWEEFRENKGDCLTIGFFVGEDDEFLWVASTVAPDPKRDPMMSGAIKIPKAWTTFYQVMGENQTGRQTKVVAKKAQRKPRRKRGPVGFLSIEKARNETPSTEKPDGTPGHTGTTPAEVPGSVIGL